MKKKIIVDLDVVTVALWDSRGKNTELARNFLARVERKEFYLGTPFLIIEIVLKWKHEKLKNNIKEFFVKNSEKLITDTEIKEKCDELNVDYELILNKLENAGIKREDAALVLVASLFSFECLVTFNRIHLKNKEEEANKILKEWKLPTILILGPEEL
ncbi:hypothetical protein HYY71_04155 [Candidatus Woesearchaeota archaeon]|nr:hypothetical protein [Candidatus Woesearchaeota archaeon]